MNTATQQKIGKVSGPGEEIGELKIQTKDNRLSKEGEYLFYRAQLPEGPSEVFLTITGRRLQRSLPSSFLADPETDAEEVAAALGIENALGDLEYELNAKILGYFDPKLKSFINPRLNPDPNTDVYLAQDEQLEKILFAKTSQEKGSVAVGKLLLRPELPVLLDADEMISTHLAILAGTGSGKSYLTRVLVEELMLPHNFASILIFDPHGEYQTLQKLSGLSTFRQGPHQAQVNCLRPGENLQILLSALSSREITALLPDMSEKMAFTLETLINAVRKKAPNQEWTLDDLNEEIQNRLNDSSEEGNEAATLTALNWRLNAVLGRQEKQIFVGNRGTSLRELCQPGLCTVIDLSGVEEREQQVLATVLLNKIFKARLRHERNEQEKDLFNAVEYPVFVILEEAHRFAPQGDTNVVSTRILRKILAEGRKFGVGIGLISQRPGKLDQHVLSQCMTQFLMRIINPVDQESIKQGVESAGRDLLKELPSLSKGQAIAVGVALRTPVLLQVREAFTPHGGTSKRPTTEWTQAQSPQRQISAQAQRASLRIASTADEPWNNH